MEQNEENVTTTPVVEEQTPVVEVPSNEPSEVTQTQQEIPVQQEFVSAGSAPVQPVVTTPKKENFFIKNKVLIGGITAAVLTIVILCAVFIPHLNKLSIPDPNAGKNIEDSYSEKDKLISILKLESGSKIPKYEMFFNNSKELKSEFKIEYYLGEQSLTLDDVSVEENGSRYLKGTNTYTIKLISDTETLTTSLEVTDTQIPAVVLKTLNVNYGEEYNPKDFVNQYDDNSKDYAFTVTLKDKTQNKFSQSGRHTVHISICDSSNNCVEQRATVVVGDKSQALTGTKEQEITVKTEDMKYGLKKVTYVNVTYNVYNDGSTEELRRGSEQIKVDQSGFNGTVSTMKEEMLTNYASYNAARTAILNKTNEYRKEKGLKELVLDENLSEVATLRAMEIAYSGKLDHTRPNGKDWTTMWEEYNGKERSTVMAENIAGEYDTDIQVVTEWHNSKSHNAIMLEERFTKIGIGKYSFNGKTYWVQHFEE